MIVLKMASKHMCQNNLIYVVFVIPYNLLIWVGDGTHGGIIPIPLSLIFEINFLVLNDPLALMKAVIPIQVA